MAFAYIIGAFVAGYILGYLFIRQHFLSKLKHLLKEWLPSTQVKAKGFEPLIQSALTHIQSRIERMAWEKNHLFETLNEPAVILDEHYCILQANPRFYEFTEQSSNKEPQLDFLSYFHTQSHPTLKGVLHEIRQRPLRAQLRLRLASGATKLIQLSATPHFDNEGAFQYMTLFLFDISQLEELRSLVDSKLLFDAPTGLLSYTGFLQFLDLMLSQTIHLRKPVTLLFIRFDALETYIIRHGYEIADLICKNYARHIQIDEATHAIARMAFNELCILLQDVSLDQGFHIAENIRKSFQNFYESLPEDLHTLTMSIAIVTHPDHGETREELFSLAQSLLSTAEKMGGDVILTPERIPAYAQASFYVRSSRELLKAFRNNQIRTHFQPIVHLPTGEIFGWEALARWHTRDGTILPASQFLFQWELLPPGEQLETQLILYQNSLETFFTQNESDLLFLNIVPVLIRMDDEFLTFCEGILVSGFSPERIVFEISERLIVRDFHELIAFTSYLKNLGFLIAIDDFGSGFTSFHLLRELHLDYIKIDGSFIRGIPHSLEKQTFLKSFRDIATSLNMQVIAECVETKEEFEWLVQSRILYGQGYYLGYPTPSPVHSEDEKL